MNCPKCGSPVQPYDRFCIRCGHDMQPAGAAERPQTTATYNPVQGVGTQATPTYTAQSPFGGVTPPQQPFGAPAQNSGPNGSAWASGSSTPGPNPYASTPSTVGNGTMLNGRPATNSQGRGLLQGAGAAIVAFFVILAKSGAALAGAFAGLGFIKWWLILWLAPRIFHTSTGAVLLVILALIIIGSVAHSRGLV